MWPQKDTRAVITKHRNIKGVISEVNAIRISGWLEHCTSWLALLLWVRTRCPFCEIGTGKTRTGVALSECSGKLYVLVSEAREEDFARLFALHEDELRHVQLAVARRLAFLPGEVCGGGSKFQLPACFPLPEESDICRRPNWWNLLALSTQQVGKLRHSINCAAVVRAQHFPLWDQRFWFRT